jgi:hypothetical protein
MVTETQFNDALSRIFLRFDKTDEKIDRNYQQLRASIDHVGTALDESLQELRAMNLKMDARIARIEDIESSR